MENDKNKKKEGILVVTPRLNSRFSPVVILGKTPVMKKKNGNDPTQSRAKNLLNLYGKKENENIEKIIEEKTEDKEKIALKRKERTIQFKKNLVETLPEEFPNKTKIYDELLITDAVYFNSSKKLASLTSDKDLFTLSEKDDNSDDEEETNIGGYFYINKLEGKEDYERQWFKLLKKDLICNYNNIIYLFNYYII